MDSRPRAGRAPEHRPRSDVFARYRELRRSGPVVRGPAASDEGAWYVLGHAEAESVLRDDRFSADRRRSPAFAAGLREVPPDLRPESDARSMLQTDPPDHERLRRLVSKAFTPRRVDQLEARLRAIAHELIDDVAPARAMDAVEDFAEPLPAIAIAELLGVPPEDHPRFRSWTRDLLGGLVASGANARVERFRASRDALFEYLREIVEARRREPGDDLISALAQARERDDALSDRELLATCNLLLVAGHETTTSLIGSGLLRLLRNPPVRDRLRADPGGIPPALEEFLRLESPLQAVARVALEDVEIGGVHIDAGALVSVMIGAANRDPAVFEEPDELDVRRDPNPHLAFGSGRHFCLGASLARLGGRIAFEVLLDRCPDLAFGAGQVRHRTGSLLRGLRALPLSW